MLVGDLHLTNLRSGSILASQILITSLTILIKMINKNLLGGIPNI